MISPKHVADAGTGQYLPFSEVTRRSLEETIATAGLELTGSITSDLMHAYDSLSVFPDVPRTLDTLSSIAGVKAVIFTNGTESMASNSVNKSPDLSAHAKVFEQVVVVEAVQKFKPDPATYHHLRRRLNKQEESVDRIWLVSGNPFDIVGSRSLGLNAIWVDRQQSGWHDALIAGESGRPTAIVNELQDVLKIATG